MHPDCIGLINADNNSSCSEAPSPTLSLSSTYSDLFTSNNELSRSYIQICDAFEGRSFELKKPTLSVAKLELINNKNDEFLNVINSNQNNSIPRVKPLGNRNEYLTICQKKKFQNDQSSINIQNNDDVWSAKISLVLPFLYLGNLPILCYSIFFKLTKLFYF